MAAWRAGNVASDARQAASEVTRRFDSLLLINMAMWSLLEEKLGLTEDQLAARVREIDLRDGKLDGRVAPTELPECPQCGRKPQRHRPLCLYCGQALVNDPFQR